ncbi:MAG: aldehyde ferredoxin oxidoreductase C-terminal domain-containing protein [Rhodospirillales bacterium]
MRKYLDINLETQTIASKELDGETIAKAGRYHIAKTLLAAGAATVDPLSPKNPLIFSVGPFAGTNFSNANRLSVGCKSPLTGGIKEANSGGTFGFAMGQLELAGFTLHGACKDWTIIYIPKEGDIRFESAEGFLGKGNMETAVMLHEKYGDKVSLALCSNVGEYQGLMAGIAFSDPENRPERLAARGGVGAVMGSKKVKAIICEKHKLPPFKERKKVIMAVRDYGKKLDEQPAIHNMRNYGTSMMGDVMNHMGGIPVRSFSSGQVVDKTKEAFKLGGEYIRNQNLERGGETTHACMPGCQIQCSNIYVDKDGNEIVSPVEYETLGLMGTNCGLEDPDDLARVNAVANDLGIDTIEIGATLAMLMDAGQAEFGDVEFMFKAMEDIGKGNERGRILSQGAARVGEHYGIKRIPAIKKQAISAYDPRVIEVTGISMMITAMGADHTTGNLATFECQGKDTQELAEASFGAQVDSAAADCLGLCLFGRSVTDTHHDFITDTINDAFGCNLDSSFIKETARQALIMEAEFNTAAGFTDADDELPSFFYDEAIAPTDKKARHHTAEINKYKSEWIAEHSA